LNWTHYIEYIWEWEGTSWIASTFSDIKMHYTEYKERLTRLSTEEEEENRYYCVSKVMTTFYIGKAHWTWYRPQRQYVWRTCHPHGDGSTQKHGAKNRTEKNVGVRIQHDKRKLTMTSYSMIRPTEWPHPALVFAPLEVSGYATIQCSHHLHKTETLREYSPHCDDHRWTLGTHLIVSDQLCCWRRTDVESDHWQLLGAQTTWCHRRDIGTLSAASGTSEVCNSFTRHTHSHARLSTNTELTWYYRDKLTSL